MASRENRYFRRGERSYILDGEYLPVYVGEGLGDLDYEDTVELSIIKRNALGLSATREFISLVAPPPEKLKKERTANNGKSPHTPRASKNNPYICDYCGYRTTRYDNMKKHLEKVHDDRSTDPRAKSRAIQEGLVETLRLWKGL
jgi:hypothetical protein